MKRVVDAQYGGRLSQDLKRTLWAAANKLRSSMDAAEYKHIFRGHIFLKYISDALDERRAQLLATFADEASDPYLPDAPDHTEALQERNYYTMANVFWRTRKAPERYNLPARYSLVVSIRKPGADVDLYTPIAQKVAVRAAVPIVVNI